MRLRVAWIGIVLIAGALGVVGATPAQAQGIQPFATCGDTSACGYPAPGWAGNYVFVMNEPPGPHWYQMGGADNDLESWINNRNKDIKIADFLGGGGDQACLNAFQRDIGMGVWANRVSSYKILNDASSC